MSNNNEFDQNWPKIWEELWKPLLSTDGNLDEQKVQYQLYKLAAIAEKSDATVAVLQQALQEQYDHGYETGRSEAQVESRDPRINPLPGDELTTSSDKLRVVSLWVNERGTQRVGYKSAKVDDHYGDHVNQETLLGWQERTRNPELTVLNLVD
jgi:hypothetical protein